MRKNGLPFCAICSRNIQKRRANCGGVAEGAKPARFAVLPRPQSKTCGAGSGGRANFPASEFQEYLPAGSSGALSGRCQSAGFLLMPLCAQAKTKKWICPQKRPPLPYMPPGMVLGPIYLIDKGRRRKRAWRKGAPAWDGQSAGEACKGRIAFHPGKSQAIFGRLVHTACGCLRPCALLWPHGCFPDWQVFHRSAFCTLCRHSKPPV